MEEVKEEQVPQLTTEQLTEQDKKLLENKEAMELIARLNQNLKRSLMMSRFKSIRRAGKRGHLTPAMELVPKRPFNNRANSSTRKGKHSRYVAELIRKWYENRKKRINGKTIE